MQTEEEVEAEEYRLWDELIPDALSIIFKKMSLQEILTVVPRVCKSWQKAAARPDCWQVIDIEDWSRRCKPENTDRMVRLLVGRSRGCMRKLVVCGLKNDCSLGFVGKHGQNLQILRIPMSDVTDAIAVQVASKLPCLTHLDISCCKKLSFSSLEAIGKHCKSLTHLSRNMHPQGTIDQSPKDDEAFAIAKSMSSLKHLELAYGLVTNAGIQAILSMCKNLKHLDIRGCWNVHMEESLSDQCQRQKVEVLGPVVRDYYEFDHSDDYYSDSDGNMMDDYDDINEWVYEDFDYMGDGGWDDGEWVEDLDGVQLRVYDGTNTDDSSDWPAASSAQPSSSGDQTMSP